MRLWHWGLIPVLPDKMLVSQWRECIAIKRQWEKGTLNHKLVNYVMNYDKTYFFHYVTKIVTEFTVRNIKSNYKLFQEIGEFCLKTEKDIILSNHCCYPEHNERYLKQCYYNLQEKADRGIITQKEWEKIENYVRKEKI